MTRRVGLPFASATVCAGVVLAGCSTGPPSSEDIAEQLLESGGVTDEAQARCMADRLVDSDLSDDQLDAIVDRDETDLSGEDVVEVGEVIEAALVECTPG